MESHTPKMMDQRVEIIPTVVPASFADIAAAAERYAFADALHVDFADGIFAPNTTWLPEGPPRQGLALPRGKVALEAHLMVQEPMEAGLALAASGFRRIIGHIEATGERTEEILSQWRSAGAAEVGLGILAATPIEALDPYAALVDVVQTMSIASIGVQGIPYDRRAPERIARLHARHPELLIADDGGVSENNIAELARAGVRRFCVGSALSKSADPETTYRSLIALAESGIMSVHGN